ncbi:DUF2285 domain-containing protein [Enterobacter kobei]|nr:DUF2285 domain-containing protein [Enterobacter kobei]
MYTDFAWEYLKRNSHYKQDWFVYSSAQEMYGSMEIPSPRKWGLIDFVNPNQGRLEDVFWIKELSSRSVSITFTKAGEIPASYLTNNKNFRHKLFTSSDGTSCLKIYDEHDYFQLFIDNNELNCIGSKEWFLCITLSNNFFGDLRKLRRFFIQNEKKTLRNRKDFSFLHMYDNFMEGRSLKEIANILYPGEVATSNWSSDSWLRARVRYGIRRATSLINGGYFSFL